jgi:GAF domain-containing protein
MSCRGSLSLDAEHHVAALTREIAGIGSLGQALSHALHAAISLLHADFGNIQLYRAGVLTIAVHSGFRQDFLDRFQRVAADTDCACGRAMREGRPFVVPDVAADHDLATLHDIAAKAGFRAVQSTPLVTTSGLFTGMLSTHFRKPHTPADEEMAMLGLYATAVADAIQKFVGERMLAAS